MEAVTEPAAEAEPSTQEPVAEAPAAASTPSYDESLLTFIKGRPKKPQQPDASERNTKVGVLQEEIDKHSARIREIKEIIESKHNMTQPGGNSELRSKLTALRNEWQNHLRNKQRLQVEGNDKKTERDTMMAEVRQLRDNSKGPLDPAALEQRIAELEFKMTHESLAPAEEKRAREQKERLIKVDRPNCAKYAALQARLDENTAARNEVRGRIDEVDALMKGIREQMDSIQATLDAARAKESEVRADIPALHAEKKECYDIMMALRTKQQEIRAEFDGRYRQYIKEDRAYRTWSYIERKKKQEERKKEYEERQAAKRADVAAHTPNKYDEKMYVCDQVLAYLRKYTPGAEEAAAAAAAEEAEKKEVESPAPGLKLFKKKEEENALDSMFAGKGKKGKGAKKEAAKAAGVPAGNKKLQHTMETLKTFMTLGVDVPTTAADVPKAIAAVEAKKASLAEAKEKAPEQQEEEEPEPDEAPPEEPPMDPTAAAAAAAEEAGANGHVDEGTPAPAQPTPTKGIWAARSSRAAAATAGAVGAAVAATASAVAPAVDAAKDAVAPAVDAAKDAVAPAVDAAKDAVAAAGDAVAAAASSAKEAVVAAVAAPKADAAEAAADDSTAAAGAETTAAAPEAAGKAAAPEPLEAAAPAAGEPAKTEAPAAAAPAEAPAAAEKAASPAPAAATSPSTGLKGAWGKPLAGVSAPKAAPGAGSGSVDGRVSVSMKVSDDGEGVKVKVDA